MSKGRGIRLKADENGILDIEIDLMKDSSGLILSGQVFGNTQEQNKALILSCHQGELKEYPDFGCGIEDIVNDMDFLFWERRITQMMERDGMKEVAVRVTNNNIDLKGKY